VLKENMNSEKYFHTEEVAELLSISKQTIYRYEKRGFFPSAKRNAINGWREYTEKDINKLKKLMGR